MKSTDTQPGDTVVVGTKVYLVPYVCGTCGTVVEPFGMSVLEVPLLPCGHQLKPTGGDGIGRT